MERQKFLDCLPTPSIDKVFTASTPTERQTFLDSLPTPSLDKVWAASSAETQAAFIQHMFGVVMKAAPAFAIVAKAHEVGILEPTFENTIRQASQQYPAAQPPSLTVQNYHIIVTPEIVRELAPTYAPGLTQGESADQATSSLNRLALTQGVVEPIEDEELFLDE